QLLERNSALTKEEIPLIAQQVGIFLQHATRQQKRERAIEIFKKIDKATSPDERDDLINQLGQELLAERNFDAAENPAFLAFEYLANLSMRPQQVTKLNQFLKGGDANLVMEMIMGSGKSKVLLPLLGLLRADGDALSMIIVPEPLFESIAADTQT